MPPVAGKMSVMTRNGGAAGPPGGYTPKIACIEPPVVEAEALAPETELPALEVEPPEARTEPPAPEPETTSTAAEPGGRRRFMAALIRTVQRLRDEDDEV